MSQATLREHLLNSSCCNRCELLDDGIFCRSCNRLVIRLPKEIVPLLRCEEVWAEKWDGLHSMLSDLFFEMGIAPGQLPPRVIAIGVLGSCLR